MSKREALLNSILGAAQLAKNQKLATAARKGLKELAANKPQRHTALAA
jgi:hypothetical protein